MINETTMRTEIQESLSRSATTERAGLHSAWRGEVRVFSGRLASAFWVTVTLLFVTGALPAVELTRVQTDFFENKVRPIFAAHCYECHSPAKGKVKGGLELDWKGGWEQGGDSGEAVVKPGDPEGSLLIKAIRYTDADLRMPPKDKKLSADQIATLETWVKTGAPDPRANRPDEAATAATDRRDHWAFLPVKNSAPPTLPTSPWIKNDIDRFILAKLDASGLKPNPVADPRTLIRRAYFDLIGLPPTPAEVDALLADHSANAFEKVVDQLLASPRYGERWGRHWLDVARYSDSKGQFNRNREDSLYPYAWTYRDYVIKSFNDDKPYDRFIIEQLAADQLKLAKGDPTLAAMGFLTVGDHFNGMVQDITNDRIDVTAKAFLGLTVSCARCHDHKFDPIPTADYYSLHGVFNSSVEPAEQPVIARPGTKDEQNDYQVDRLELEARLDKLTAELTGTVLGDYRKQSAIYLCALTMPEKERDDYVRKNGGDPSLVRNWQRLVQAGARRDVAIFGPWLMLARMPDNRFAQQAPRMLANLDRNPQSRGLNPSVMKALKSANVRTKGDLAVTYGNLIAGQDASFNAAMQKLVGEVAPRLARGRQQGQYRQLREQLATLEMAHPGSPGRAMVMVDVAKPSDSPIFIRGEAENRGREVPRQFLEVLSGPNRKPFTHGSGRLDLAHAIASTNNPLSARVLVNRVWLHHFGEGFVSTPDDFGTQAEAPSHPELLDYLATRFTQGGWSIKKLHQEILLSATWQQSSANHPEFAVKDPFNRLLWRANVRRLEFEPMRDAILYVGGQLDLTVGGKPVDISEGTHLTQRRGASALTRGGVTLSQDHRRSVYGYVDRSDLMEMLGVFDFASPDMPTGKRYQTAVPQQALFLMNSPLVIDQAKNVVARPEFVKLAGDEGRIRFLYELLLQREPTAAEIELGRAFVGGARLQAAAGDLAGPPANVAGQVRRNRPNRDPAPITTSAKPLSGWAEYAHALLLTDEICFVN